MFMDDATYLSEADKALSLLLDAAEENESMDASLDYGTLSIKLPSGGEYIINRHMPTKQIWVSSPVSGAAYFAQKTPGSPWLRLRPLPERELVEFIREEMERQTEE